MTMLCALCHGTNHTSSQCPIYITRSHGTPRADTPGLAQLKNEGPTQPSKPSKPSKPTVPRTSHELTRSAEDQALILELKQEIHHLKQELAKRAPTASTASTANAPVAAAAVTVTTDPLPKKAPPSKAGPRGPRKSGNAMTNAQKQAAYRARKRLKSQSPQQGD